MTDATKALLKVLGLDGEKNITRATVELLPEQPPRIVVERFALDAPEGVTVERFKLVPEDQPPAALVDEIEQIAKSCGLAERLAVFQDAARRGVLAIHCHRCGGTGEIRIGHHNMPDEVYGCPDCGEVQREISTADSAPACICGGANPHAFCPADQHTAHSAPPVVPEDYCQCADPVGADFSRIHLACGKVHRRFSPTTQAAFSASAAPVDQHEGFHRGDPPHDDIWYCNKCAWAEDWIAKHGHECYGPERRYGAASKR